MSIRRWICAALAMTLLWGAPARGVDDAAPEPITFSCLINHTWYPVQSFTGIIPQEITARTGVALDVTVASDARQINILIASGNLPDLIYTQTQLDKLSTSQYCYDYDSLIATYGVDWEIDPDLRQNALFYSRDGKLYTVINHYAKTEDWAASSAVPVTASLMVRQDLLDALGNPEIRTTDELRDVYLRVMDAFPGVIPLTFDATHRFNVFRVFFGLGLESFAQQPDGSYLYYARDPRYRGMLAFLSDLYRRDCLLVDSFAAAQSDADLLYRRGQSFSHSGCTQNMNISLDAALKEQNPRYKSVELVPLDGSRYTMSNLGWSGTFITKNCKDPQRAIEFIAWMFTPEAQRLTQWGREGEDYVLGEDNMPVYSDALIASIANDTYRIKYNPWFYFGASAIVEAEGRCALLDIADYERPYSAIRALTQNLPWIAASMPISGTREQDINEAAEDIALMNETRIILSESEADFEAHYDSYMRELDALGIAELETYVAQRIPAQIEKYASGRRLRDE